MNGRGNPSVVEIIRECVGKRGGTTGVLNQRASEDGEKGEKQLHPTGDTQGHGPSTQRTRIDTDTEGCKGINICINEAKQ